MIDSDAFRRPYNVIACPSALASLLLETHPTNSPPSLVTPPPLQRMGDGGGGKMKWKRARYEDLSISDVYITLLFSSLSLDLPCFLPTSTITLSVYLRLSLLYCLFPSHSSISHCIPLSTPSIVSSFPSLCSFLCLLLPASHSLRLCVRALWLNVAISMH